MSSSINTYPNGSYLLTATATDGVGNIATTTAISVTVSNADTIAPTITITAPTDGTKTTLSKINVTHTAVDNQKVTKVELYQDGVLKVSSITAPFTISWTTVAGTHKLQSKAYDAKNNYGWPNIVPTLST
jgi:Rieske Fe-S protein